MEQLFPTLEPDTGHLPIAPRHVIMPTADERGMTLECEVVPRYTGSAVRVSTRSLAAYSAGGLLRGSYRRQIHSILHNANISYQWALQSFA